MPCNASYARFIFGKFFTSTIILYVLLFAQKFYFCKKWVLHPDRPFSKELSAAEVNSQVHKVIDVGVNLNPRVGPAPLQGGVANSSVTMLDAILAAFMILCFHCAYSLALGPRGGGSKP
jgi:hypothetical protein